MAASGSAGVVAANQDTENSHRSAEAAVAVAATRMTHDAGLLTSMNTQDRSTLSAIVWLIALTASCGGSTTAPANGTSAGTPQQHLESAIVDQDFDAVRAAISAGARVRDPLPSGASCLNRAVVVQNVSIVRLLLASGADPNEPDPLSLATPLAAAAYATHRALVEALLKGGADPNKRFGQGLYMTALGQAAQAAASAGMGALIHAGADLNAWNLEPPRDYPEGYRGRAEGRTALMIAAADGNYSAVLGLLDGGADPRLKNEKGQTAIDLVHDSSADIREALNHPEQFQFAKKH